MSNLKIRDERKKKKLHRDNLLYKQYGKPLEEKHDGEYIAISPEGETIIGEDDIKVAQEAVEEFGSGNFALRKIGASTLGKWRKFFG